VLIASMLKMALDMLASGDRLAPTASPDQPFRSQASGAEAP
jgi:hypothetical protein